MNPVTASEKLLAVLAVIALAGCAHIAPLAIATHISDPSDGGASDTTVDFIGAGATAKFGDFSIEGAIGRKAINCDAFVDCRSTLGGMATVRWSPK